MLVVSEDMEQFQSTVISLANGSHPYAQLSAPAEGLTATTSCHSCAPHQPHTLLSGDRTLLSLTDDSVQVFTAATGSSLLWARSLSLSEDCSPLYLQQLYGDLGSFIVVCATATSFGYQVIDGSTAQIQLHPLVVLDTDVSKVVFGGFRYLLHQLDTEAFVYIWQGELNFGVISDGLPPRPIYIDLNTDCAPNTVVDIHPLPTPANGKFRFIMDCMHSETNVLLRYKVTLQPENPSFVETAHLLPQMLSNGTPIASLDSEYFVIIQHANIVAIKTEDTSMYRIKTLQHPVQEVAFVQSLTPTLAIVSPGQNHKVLFVDSFIRGNTDVTELLDTPAYCPNVTTCLPYGMAGMDLFYTFITTTSEGMPGYFHLALFDIQHPSRPLVRVENLALQPALAIAQDISLLSASSTAVVDMYQSTLAPSPTSSSQVSLSPSLPVHSSSSAAILPATSVIRSSSNTLDQTPTTDPRPNTRDKATGLIIVCGLMVCALLAVTLVVILLILIALMRKRQRVTRTFDEEKPGKSSPLSQKPLHKTVNKPEASGNGMTTVSAVSATNYETSRNLHQLVPPVILNLNKSTDTLTSKSSGVSTASGTPSTTSLQDFNLGQAPIGNQLTGESSTV